MGVEWKSPNSLTLKEGQVNSKVKRMLIIFFIKVTVQKYFVLAGQRVNSVYFCDFYSNCVKLCEEFAPNLGDEELALESQ
jgi:hypothetical protein